MNAPALKPASVLRNAAGEPPLGPHGLTFRDDQGEIIRHDNERYASVAKIGVIELDNGEWMIGHPGKGFPVDAQRWDSRVEAIEIACTTLMALARLYMATPAGQGTQWSEELGNAVIKWAEQLRKNLDHRATAQDASPIGHPVTENAASDDQAGVTDDTRGDLAGALNHNTPADPIVRALCEAHRARKLFPAGHMFGMTNPIVNGQMVTMGTCSCGESFSYAHGSYQRMDAAIEAHWQKFDHLAEKVDGRGNPITSSDGRADEAVAGIDAVASGSLRGDKPRKRRSKARMGSERPDPSEAAQALPPLAQPEPASDAEHAPLGGGAGSPDLAAPIGASSDPFWDDPIIKMAVELAWKEGDDYKGFLSSKTCDVVATGFDVDADQLNPALKTFQRDIVCWALRRGRAALFAGTGLGKTLQQLCWADRIVSQASGPVLILTPLAVAQQTVAEAEKFGIASVAYAASQQSAASRIVVTNYDRLDKFDPAAFAGVVLDESSILKSFDGKTRRALTEAFADTKFKLCCTATPAPNDYTELGTHAEFLGVLQHKEMLATWFVHEGSSRATNMENYGQRQGSDWRLKGHAHDDFWRWLASWSVMIRHPRDLGYEDAGYDLPALHRHQLTVATVGSTEGLLRELKLARSLQERLTARRETIGERVAAAASIVNASPDRQWLVWCNLNDESSALVAAIPGAVEVRGTDDADVKAERLLAFARGELRILVSKPSIAGWGMNFQRCADMVFVGLNDSFEQLYQAIRRCWRFGQTREVNVHLIAADVEGEVVANLAAKEDQADYMAEAMVGHMRGLSVSNLRSPRTITAHETEMQLPEWLKCA